MPQAEPASHSASGGASGGGNGGGVGGAGGGAGGAGGGRLVPQSFQPARFPPESECHVCHARGAEMREDVRES